MRLNRTLRIWTAALVLGALGFAHASVSIAACSMERGSMSEVLAVETSDSCDCGTAMTEYGPLYMNRCVAHCTADLQLSGAAAAIVNDPTSAPALFLPGAARSAGWPRRADVPPGASVPKRIQLHSFLV